MPHPLENSCLNLSLVYNPVLMKKPFLLIITAILYLVLADSMSLAKDSDVEIIEKYKQVVRKNPDDADAHHLLGVTYAITGMYEEAVEAFKQVIRIKPDFVPAHCGLGIAYGNLGMQKESIESYKQVIRLGPDNIGAHFNLGVAYLLLKDRGSALEQYKILKRFDSELANELIKVINE